MKISALGFSLFALTFNTTFAGNGGSGGGHSVILPSGEVRFIDLLGENEIPSHFMSKEKVLEKYFGSQRYVKTLAKKDSNFFHCAKEKLDHYKDDIPVLKNLSTQLDKISVLRVEFPLIPNKDADTIKPKELPLPLFASTSSRVDEDNQWTIASYQAGDLWVADRLYKVMSSQDQCAVQIHEALRHLNFIGALKEELTTQEIELLTSGIMNGDEIHAPAPEWQSSLQGLKKALTSKIDNYGEMEELISEFSKLYVLLQEVDGAAECSPSEKVLNTNPDHNEVAALYSQWADVIQDYILSNQYSDKLVGERQKALQISNSYLLKGVEQLIRQNQTVLKYGDNVFIKKIATQKALTEELPLFEYFDVVGMKTVNRLKK